MNTRLTYVRANVSDPAAARFIFTVEGADRVWEKLNGSADVTEALADTPWGSRKFTIRDPDGNELSFVEG